jgi:16S rRNA (uracil1498-N3)-methyltransferase
MTRRRWIADSWTESTATLTGDQANHLYRVLRAEPGMEFDVLAGGFVWRSVITSAQESAVEFQFLEELTESNVLSLTVLLSIFKFDRMEWAIEKLTELGVARIEPVFARRSEKHLVQAAEKRVERWRKIGVEAAKQSRRSALPTIADPRPLAEAVKSADAQTLRLVLAETETEQALLRILQTRTSGERLVLAIGPEGGWTQEEGALFQESEWTPVTLGPTILRAETAAIAAVSIAAAWLNG